MPTFGNAAATSLALPAMDRFGLAAEAIRYQRMNAGDGAAEVEAVWVRAGESLGVVAFLGPTAVPTQSPGLNLVQKSRAGRLRRSAEWTVKRCFGLPRDGMSASLGDGRLDVQPSPAD